MHLAPATCHIAYTQVPPGTYNASFVLWATATTLLLTAPANTSALHTDFWWQTLTLVDYPIRVVLSTTLTKLPAAFGQSLPQCTQTAKGMWSEVPRRCVCSVSNICGW